MLSKLRKNCQLCKGNNGETLTEPKRNTRERRGKRRSSENVNRIQDRGFVDSLTIKETSCISGCHTNRQTIDVAIYMAHTNKL
jgi:predicted metal-binding protein